MCASWVCVWVELSELRRMSWVVQVEVCKLNGVSWVVRAKLCEYRGALDLPRRSSLPPHKSLGGPAATTRPAASDFEMIKCCTCHAWVAADATHKSRGGRVWATCPAASAEQSKWRAWHTKAAPDAQSAAPATKKLGVAPWRPRAQQLLQRNESYAPVTQKHLRMH